MLTWFAKKRWDEKEVPFINDLNKISSIVIKHFETRVEQELNPLECEKLLSFFQQGKISEMYKCASSFEIIVTHEQGRAVYYVHHKSIGPKPGGLIQNIFTPRNKVFYSFIHSLGDLN